MPSSSVARRARLARLAPAKASPQQQTGMPSGGLRPAKHLAETLRAPLGQGHGHRQLLFDEEAVRGQVQIAMLAGLGQEGGLGGPAFLQGQDSLGAEIMAIELFDRGHLALRGGQPIEVRKTFRQGAAELLRRLPAPGPPDPAGRRNRYCPTRAGSSSTPCGLPR